MAVKSLLRAEGSGDIRDGAGTAPFITARDVDELQAQAGLLPHPEPPPAKYHLLTTGEESGWSPQTV